MNATTYFSFTTSQLKRFWRQVSKHEDPSGCWEWTGLKNPGGYGKFFANPRYWLAHRASYEIGIGPIPDGLTIDHLCRNRACVNPAHMDVVTLRENVLRAEPGSYQKAKTHCPLGHEYTLENTIDRGDGKRQCRACTKRQAHESYLNNHPGSGNGVIPKTHCPQGHELTPENSYLDSKNKTTKRCRICGRNQVTAGRKRRKESASDD